MASFPAVMIAATGATVVSGPQSASIAVPNSADGNRARFVMVTALAPAYVKWGASGVTARASDVLVAPGQPVVFAVKPFTHMAYLQHAEPATLNIVPVEF